MMADAKKVGASGGRPANDHRDRGDDSPQDAGDGGTDDSRKRFKLDDRCPVKPLGTANGIYFYLDELCQLREIKPKEHEKKTLESLFGRRSDLCEVLWPRLGKPIKNKDTGETEYPITGWKPEEAGRQFMGACAERGVWSAAGKVRGAGSHRGEYGELILHCGDAIWLGSSAGDGRWVKPGLIEELVYPAADKIQRPAIKSAGVEAGREVLALLGTWNWERGSSGPGDAGIDATLALGWIAASLICGALEWRPAAWITGGRGTGKSTLQKLIKWLLGNGLIEAADVTEAWVRQTLKMRTLPIAIDELEAEEDGRRVAAIVKLARLAASGVRMGRGSADHSAQDFTMRSSFLFSSILVPPLTPADRSRLAMLELKALKGDAMPKLDPEHIQDLGRQLLKRMVDQWDRLDETIALYREWLAQYGHDARMQDQFGTLLGCADCLLYEDLPCEEQLSGWARRLDAKHLAEKAADESEGQLCARFMATSPLQAVGGAEPEPLSLWINKTAMLPAFVKSNGPFDDPEGKSRHGQRRLENAGFKVVISFLVKGDDDKDERRTRQYFGNGEAPPNTLYLAVANSHEALARMMRDTRWKGGVWQQALGRLPGAIKLVKIKLAGRGEWCTLVPLAELIDVGDADDGAS